VRYFEPHQDAAQLVAGA